MYVVITGASRGIGKALAYEFASKGYNLFLTCEEKVDLLKEVEKDITEKYGKKVKIKKGLIDKYDLNDINDIYILINNAGKCDYNLISNVTYEKYKEITYANLDYAFLTSKLVVQNMLRNKQGIIVNISSMWGILGSSCEVVYSMTKAGLIGFTKALAKELKDSSIDVIAFALGAVNTDMCKGMTDDATLKKFIKTLDNGRMYEPSEIVTKIYDYICKKNYVTGDVIELNNGLK